MKGQAAAEQASPGAAAHGRSEAAGPPPSGAEARGSKPACAGLDGPKRRLPLAAPRLGRLTRS